MAVGLVFTMKSIDVAGLRLGPYVFGAGVLGVLYTMLSWWRDVIRRGDL